MHRVDTDRPQLLRCAVLNGPAAGGAWEGTGRLASVRSPRYWYPPMRKLTLSDTRGPVSTYVLRSPDGSSAHTAFPRPLS